MELIFFIIFIIIAVNKSKNRMNEAGEKAKKQSDAFGGGGWTFDIENLIRKKQADRGVQDMEAVVRNLKVKMQQKTKTAGNRYDFAEEQSNRLKEQEERKRRDFEERQRQKLEQQKKDAAAGKAAKVSAAEPSVKKTKNMDGELRKPQLTFSVEEYLDPLTASFYPDVEEYLFPTIASFYPDGDVSVFSLQNQQDVI